MLPIVVAGNGSSAYVDARADDRVTKIGQVICFGALSHADLLGLHKIADVSAASNLASGSQMRIRAQNRIRADLPLIDDAARLHQNVIAQFRVADHTEGTDVAVRSDTRAPEELHAGFNHSIG